MANSNVGGAWLLPDRDLTFKLTQEGSAVRGEFGNKVLTYGVAGTVEGRKLSLSWKLVFGWSDRPDSGSGVLTLSPDGAILSGSFPLVGQNGNWTLTRPPAVATPAPPPAAHPGLPFPLPPQRQSFGGPPTTPADRDPAFRRFQDRAEDSARDAGFRYQAPRAVADGQAEVTARTLIPPAPSPAA